MPFAVKIAVIMVAMCSMSQGGSGRIARLFCEALGYEIKQYGKVHPICFFVLVFDGRNIFVHLIRVLWGILNHIHTSARAHTHIHARVCIR